MFEWDGSRDREVEELESRLTRLEGTVRKARAQQAQILARLDQLQVDLAEGDRGMEDWTSRHLDLSPQASHRLMVLARSAPNRWWQGMRQGLWGPDRASFLVKLEAAGAPPEVVGKAATDHSLGKLWGLVERYRQITSDQEQANFESRYLVVQPSLDQSVFKIFGQLPGVDGETVDQALRQKAGQFPNLPGQNQGQLLADALVSVCADSLTQGSEPSRRAVTVADVFIDAALAAPTAGEAGVPLKSGLRAGPETLAEVLCDGRVRITWTDPDQGPIAFSHQTEIIPPAIRNFIWKRDQVQCAIDGCRSRHRLQIHHLTPRSQGGNHHPHNLTLLCWYHHHVAIHGLGFRIDPHSPTHRRRLQPPGWQPTTGPPRQERELRIADFRAPILPVPTNS
jgi:hypothetical protein